MMEMVGDGTLFDENFSRKKIDDQHHAIWVRNTNSPRALSVLDFNSPVCTFQNSFLVC
jgi:hypothetical protein